MSSLIPALLVAMMIATALVLFAGVIGFAFSPRLNAKYGTALMTTRVVLQAITIALFAVLVLFHLA